MELPEIFNLRLMNEVCEATITNIGKEDRHYICRDYLKGAKIRVTHMNMLYSDDFVSVDVVFEENVLMPGGFPDFKKGDKECFTCVKLKFNFKPQNKE